MDNTTTTLPLKLFRGRNSKDIDNEIAREIGQLTPNVAERPDWVSIYANNIERLRGQLDVLRQLERQFYDAVHWGVEQRWTMQQTLLLQYDILIDLASMHPDDVGGSRLNDSKRAYNDGRREVIQWVARELRNNQWFPGNELTALNVNGGN